MKTVGAVEIGARIMSQVSLVTFSDESMSRAADLCMNSAGRNGVKVTLWYQKQEIWKTGFYEENKSILDNPKGCGLWAWKPRIIQAAMQSQVLADGDILIYADAGIEFINNVPHIIDRMDQDIFLFGNNWEHAHWCKRDVVDEVWPCIEWGVRQGADTYAENSTWDRFGKQVQASVIFFRVSDYSRKFVKEWLDWCLFEGGRLIDDSPSRAPNHPEFREHRHDQAILTTLAYREGIKLHWWPAVYNKGGSPEFVYEKLREYAGDTYPCLFSHHRKRNHEWPVSSELAEVARAVERHGRNYMAMLAEEREARKVD